MTRGVVPVSLCGTCRLTRCRCLLCLLASQTALTPSADPQGKPGLHHAHLPLLHGEAMASQAGRFMLRLRIPACDARRRQRAGTVQASTIRSRSESPFGASLVPSATGDHQPDDDVGLSHADASAMAGELVTGPAWRRRLRGVICWVEAGKRSRPVETPPGCWGRRTDRWPVSL